MDLQQCGLPWGAQYIGRKDEPGVGEPMNTVKSANPGPYQPNARYVLLLGLMCALPAVTSDIYLPSLPDVARDLHTTTTAVQLTMTAQSSRG